MHGWVPGPVIKVPNLWEVRNPRHWLGRCSPAPGSSAHNPCKWDPPEQRRCLICDIVTGCKIALNKREKNILNKKGHQSCRNCYYYPLKARIIYARGISGRISDLPFCGVKEKLGPELNVVRIKLGCWTWTIALQEVHVTTSGR